MLVLSCPCESTKYGGIHADNAKNRVINPKLVLILNPVAVVRDFRKMNRKIKIPIVNIKKLIKGLLSANIFISIGKRKINQTNAKTAEKKIYLISWRFIFS